MPVKHQHLDKEAPGLFERWQAGERYPALAREARVPIGTLRHRFKQLAGGEEAYRVLAAQRNSTHGPSVRTTAPPPDDTGVPVVASTRIGWQCEQHYGGEPRERRFAGRTFVVRTGTPYLVVVAPTGERYVDARANEPADLILAAARGLPARRLKKEVG